jgi:hypothetical protein
MIVVAVIMFVLYFGLAWMLPPLTEGETMIMNLAFIIALIAAESLYIKYIVYGGKPPMDDSYDPDNNRGGFYENF